MKTKIIAIIILIVLFSCKKENLKKENKSELQISILIPDTLKIGTNYGKVFGYTKKPKGNDMHLLTVIVENEYGNNEIRRDTFSDGTLEPFFKILRTKKGKQLLKFSIEEKIVSDMEIKSDTSTLLISTNEYYYSREFLVLDEEFNSIVNNKLIDEMKLKYNE